jgi:hypothetical protein
MINVIDIPFKDKISFNFDREGMGNKNETLLNLILEERH